MCSEVFYRYFGGHCIPLPQVEECICCIELPRIVLRIEQCPVAIPCIVDHPGFQTICLDVWSLQVAYLAYAGQYGQMDIVETPR